MTVSIYTYIQGQDGVCQGCSPLALAHSCETAARHRKRHSYCCHDYKSMWVTRCQWEKNIVKMFQNAKPFALACLRLNLQVFKVVRLIVIFTTTRSVAKLHSCNEDSWCSQSHNSLSECILVWTHSRCSVQDESNPSQRWLGLPCIRTVSRIGRVLGDDSLRNADATIALATSQNAFVPLIGCMSIQSRAKAVPSTSVGTTPRN